MTEGNGAVRGSVVQRTFVPEGLNAVLNIATAPVTELCNVDEPEELDFTALVANVLGLPVESILDQHRYAQLEPRLDRGEFRFAHPFWEEYVYLLRRGQLGPPRPFGQEPGGVLAADALTLIAQFGATRFAGVYHPPMQLLSFHGRESLGPEETFDLALQCFFASRSANERVHDFVQSVSEYDVPSGQSPATTSDTLQRVIAGSSKACLAPIAVGGTAALTQLGNGAYVSALLYTGTGAAMTLVLVGTVMVADYLVQYMRHRRDALQKLPATPAPRAAPSPTRNPKRGAKNPGPARGA
jgi:hypothetical protein